MPASSTRATAESCTLQPDGCVPEVLLQCYGYNSWSQTPFAFPARSCHFWFSSPSAPFYLAQLLTLTLEVPSSTFPFTFLHPTPPLWTRQPPAAPLCTRLSCRTESLMPTPWPPSAKPFCALPPGWKEGPLLGSSSHVFRVGSKVEYWIQSVTLTTQI